MLEIMDTDYQSSNIPNIKVIGVGGCGNNAINRLAHQTPYPIQFVAINTDQMVLDKSEADTCITIGKKLTGGFGAGGGRRFQTPAFEGAKGRGAGDTGQYRHDFMSQRPVIPWKAG